MRFKKKNGKFFCWHDWAVTSHEVDYARIYLEIRCRKCGKVESKVNFL